MYGLSTALVRAVTAVPGHACFGAVSYTHLDVYKRQVKDPADPSKFLGVLTAADTFVVTSGIYERGFEENGVRYHHCLLYTSRCV